MKAEMVVKKKRLIREIIELQRKADRTRRQYELDVWMALTLTRAQLKSLFFISNQGSTNSKELAAALRVTPTNTTGIVDRLVKQGLVSRTEDTRDRRMLLLRATDEGEELLAKLRERRRGYMSEVLACMSVDELATLAQGLASLVKAAQDYEGENKETASR
jgi:DNA-binding MarR family transcriptional regulator